MNKEWCKCDRFSCERIITKVDDGYEADPNRRYMLVKTPGGTITSETTFDGGFYKGGSKIENSIENCEIRSRMNSFKDSLGTHINNIEVKMDSVQTQPELPQTRRKKKKNKRK